MKKRKIQEARKHLQKARRLVNNISTPFQKMPLTQAIEKMRKVREELWEEKFAISAGHK